MPLVNCKVELKLEWKKYGVLSAAGADNADTDSDNINFTIKEAKLHVPLVTLPAKRQSKIIKTSRIRFCWSQ